jgi:hypothetical protein
MGSSKRPMTMDHLRSRKKPITQRVTLCLDSEVADKFNELSVQVQLIEQQVLDRSTPELRRQLEDKQAELEEMQPSVEEASCTFVFKSLGRVEFEKLLDEYPPTKEQREAARKKGEDIPNFNVDTFPPVLVAACMIEPELSLDDVKSLWSDDNWNTAELTSLWLAAFNANQQRRVVDLGKG